MELKEIDKLIKILQSIDVKEVLFVIGAESAKNINESITNTFKNKEVVVWEQEDNCNEVKLEIKPSYSFGRGGIDFYLVESK